MVPERTDEGMDEPVKARAVELERAHERLRQTQFELVQHEKMSMLGQLAAGMAHEVNTPTAAILNTAVDAAERLQELLALAMRLDELPAETRGWLEGRFKALFSEETTRSESALRSERRQVEKRLRKSGHGDYRRMAEVVVAYGMTELADDEGLLENLSKGTVLSIMEHALALKVSAEISEASAKKIARIVRSLRFYAHDSQGALSDIDVNETIENTLVIMRNRIKHIAQVKTDLAEDLPSVACGADLLQVWTNILTNACDAIDESQKEGMALIEITSRLVDKKVVVEISNEGEPIPADVIQTMFDPFYTTKRVGKGTGLGLSICTGILGRYDGTVRARNETGRVTFEVSLPTKTNCQEGTEHPEETPVGSTASFRS